jgi:Amidohydrolase family
VLASPVVSYDHRSVAVDHVQGALNASLSPSLYCQHELGVFQPLGFATATPHSVFPDCPGYPSIVQLLDVAVSGTRDGRLWHGGWGACFGQTRGCRPCWSSLRRRVCYAPSVRLWDPIEARWEIQPEAMLLLVSSEPAEALGLSDVGALSPGKTADFVVLPGVLRDDPSALLASDAVVSRGAGTRTRLLAVRRARSALFLGLGLKFMPSRRRRYSR